MCEQKRRRSMEEQREAPCRKELEESRRKLREAVAASKREEQLARAERAREQKRAKEQKAAEKRERDAANLPEQLRLRGLRAAKVGLARAAMVSIQDVTRLETAKLREPALCSRPTGPFSLCV